MNVEEYIASGVLEAVVLGVATDQEQRAAQCLSGIYPEIAEVLENYSSGLESFAIKTAVAPPAGLKSLIFFNNLVIEFFFFIVFFSRFQNL